MKSETNTNEKTVTFNRIGIDDTLDWARIQKLLKIGVFASILGIIGYLLFGPCGFHVSICGIVFMYKHLQAAGVAAPEELLSTYLHYFFLPAFILFWIFFLVLEGAHIVAFVKGKTPLPKWSFVFSMPFGLLLAKCVNVFGNHPIVNAIDCAWIHIACLWTFVGLLAVSRSVSRKTA